ncbi:MAG: Uma2 family endonuclease [Dehalococcoidia bacterium]
MVISTATYEQVALEDGDSVWEYVCGALREKPSMTQAHNDVAFYLAHSLASQLDRSQFRVRSNAGRIRTTVGNAYVPDVMVVATSSSLSQKSSRTLEAFDEPVPFVAEVWSPSTGAYDIDAKLPEYRTRGDAVIWRIHPYDKTVQAWERQADGSYIERLHRSGSVPIPSLPGVAIVLNEIFE